LGTSGHLTDSFLVEFARDTVLENRQVKESSTKALDC
jgi:hypothetical protein